MWEMDCSARAPAFRHYSSKRAKGSKVLMSYICHLFPISNL